MTSLIPIRDENPTHRRAIVTLLIIAANVVVFFSVDVSDLTQVFRYAAVPCDVLDRCPAGIHPGIRNALDQRSGVVSLFTSMFMHADILHLAFNMLFLWVFGNNVEDRLGRVRFTIFYLATGLAAAFAHIGFNTDSVIPVVGASGAISGILGAYAILWPTATIVSIVPLGFFFFPVRMPAWLMLGLWFVVQILGGLAGLGLQQEGGVAFLAHAGGFVAGMLLIVPFGGRRRSRATFESV